MHVIIGCIMKQSFIKSLSFSGLSLIFFTLAVSVLLFFTGITITSLNFILANIISLIFCTLILKNFKQALLSHIINFVIIYILAVFFFTTKDFSSDVILYHLPAMNLLKSGWNPVNINTANLPLHDWAKFFAKAPWIICTCFAAFFNNFEASKLLNAFMIYLSALFFYGALRLYIKDSKICCIILAFSVGFNAVSMMQMFTFLVDGFLSSCLIIFVASIALFYKTKDKIFLYAMAFSLCLCVNAKLSAFAYVFIIGTGAVYFFRKDLQYIITFAGSLLLSLFIFGFNPYGINLIKHHNPFYPIGSSDIKIVEGFCPESIKERFYITKFVISQFAEANADKNEKVRLKIPFAITKREINLANCPQLNLSGFGFLFSGTLILSFIFMLFAFKKKGSKDFLIAEGILLLSVFINPECWWARFVPQFCLFPVIFAAFLLIDADKKYKAMSYVLTAAIFFNVILTGFLHCKKVFEYQKIQNELTYILQHFKGEIYVNSNEMNIEGIKLKLNSYNIRFKEQNGTECIGKRIKYSTIPLCLIPKK